MAKPKKYPKTPKKTASLRVWEGYKARCQAVDKYNAGLRSDKAKKESVIKSVTAIKSKR
jgi:hypothetical protein